MGMAERERERDEENRDANMPYMDLAICERWIGSKANNLNAAIFSFEWIKKNRGNGICELSTWRWTSNRAKAACVVFHLNLMLNRDREPRESLTQAECVRFYSDHHSHFRELFNRSDSSIRSKQRHTGQQRGRSCWRKKNIFCVISFLALKQTRKTVSKMDRWIVWIERRKKNENLSLSLSFSFAFVPIRMSKPFTSK